MGDAAGESSALIGVLAGSLIRPMLPSLAILQRDGLVVIASSVLLVAIALATGSLTRPVGAVLLLLFARFGRRVGRAKGAVLLAAYGGYVGYLLMR